MDVEVLAETRHLGAVDDGPPPPAGVALADVELDRVRPDIDHRIARRPISNECRKAPRVAGVDVGVEANAADSGDDGGRVLRLDRDRPRTSSVRHHIGGLGRAAAQGVADAPLVDRDRPHPTARRHQLGEELLQRVGRSGARGRGDPKGVEDPGHRGRRQREPLLHHRLPPLQAVGVDLAEQLDVHEVGADLDVGAGRREQVELVALLDRLRGLRGQGGLRGPEAVPEDSPFPTRDDRGHGRTPRWGHCRCALVSQRHSACEGTGPTHCSFSTEDQPGRSCSPQSLTIPRARGITSAVAVLVPLCSSNLHKEAPWSSPTSRLTTSSGRCCGSSSCSSGS